MIFSNVLNMIGNTPIYRFKNNVYAKAEFLNPGGSIKDRVALNMLEEAERSGLIDKNTVIIEATSGNTGISIALIGMIKGYKVKIVMPENMSIERRKLISVFGAEVILTPAEDNIIGAIEYAKELKRNSDNVFIPNQFENKANPRVHYEKTAPEIWESLNGKINCFISGIGSGGTIQGIGTYIKERNPKAKIIAIEPKKASVLLGHEPGLHQIQGIGDGFIPKILDVNLIDDVIEVSDEDAIQTTLQLAKENGLLAGISSGANHYAANIINKNIKGNIVTILPDRIERYLSTSMMNVTDNTCKSSIIEKKHIEYENHNS